MRNDKGISLIAVTIVMLVVATLALVIASTISSGNITSVTDLQEQQAFYIAQAGIEWYMEQLENDSDWSDNTSPVISDQPFDVGRFTVECSAQEIDSIDITVTGKVTGWDGNDVQRIITAHLEKTEEGATFADFAIFYGGGDGTVTTDINKNQTITGDIFIHGDLDIGKNCTITGDVLATGEITVGSGTNISGDTIEDADPPADQPTLDTSYYDNLIATAATQPAGDRDFEGETISGTIYVNGDVEIDDYIDGSGTIVATGSIEIIKETDIGDDITLIASETLIMRKNGNVGTEVTFYSSSNIDIKTGIVFGSGAGNGEGVILLSPGDVALGNNTTITGFIFGDDVTLGTNLTLTGNISGNRLISLGQGGVVTQNDSKVDYGSIEGFDSGEEVSITTSLWQEQL
jgi:predicted acyltransferase (DUF342 family)/type II secretory pathway pseudopilin PulG